MKTTRFVILLLLVLGFAGGACAQDFNIPVFRGELAEKYNFPIDGTVYAYSDEFETGEVVFNGKLYTGLMMNLNAHRDELLVAICSTGERMALRRDLVGDFIVGKRNYTSLCGERAVKGLQQGYYQVLHRGDDMLLKRIHKTVSDRIESFTRQTVKVFTTKHRYYLVKDGKVYTIKNERGLAKFYRQDKDRIKDYVKRNRGMRVERDDLLQGIMELMED
ncbi:MAG: hypothetical protein J6U83_05165 [Bacteroidales bacterium]|nr:hypothetical protein [Bacteroidales bacterium]